ncbi:DUF1772 domain-containing protein [Streptomyces sp. JJ36]|uniref:anthrone oxygenase family protein n=1 Tax=Streptomyces sp. JJ36 TaxID=2736645 RepID=UPI001F3E8A97|nr:anthrone oxygenase family protein [Streptomyces sp. JJ36]MCF6524029.1 DUF1772 domain-containing protein [Streptomyces sp. JJ36]
MLTALQELALVAAVLLTGLMAGLYFAFSIAVLPGLDQGGARTFVTAMQGINVRILNGWFALAFAGAAVATAAAAALHLAGDGERVVPWALTGFVLYAASLVVTFRWNVPLNDALEAARPATGESGHAAQAGDPAEAAEAAREAFRPAWARWNAVRTLLCTAALGALAHALVLHGQASG